MNNTFKANEWNVEAKNPEGTNTMPLTWNKKTITGEESLYASAVYAKDENCYIVKVANVNADSKDIKIDVKGLKKNDKLVLGECLMLQSSGLGVTNSIESPSNITPQKTSARLENNTVSIHLDAQTFGVYKIKR